MAVHVLHVTAMGNLLQDLRYGLRNLVRHPGFAIAASLTLALGIGANTTIFSIINSTLLKRLPFPQPDRVMLVWETFGKGPDNFNIVSAPNFWDFKRENHSFESMAIFDSAGRGYNLSSSGVKEEAVQVSGLRVSSEFFKVLGVQPLLGRTFTRDEETLGRDREVILSYGLWKTRYGGDSSIVGKAIRVDGAPFTVVGVMPYSFGWQFWSGPRELWVPVGYTKTDFGRGDNSFLAIGRLKTGVTEAQARADLAALGARLQKQYPADNANMGATVSPLREFDMGGIRSMLLTLLAAVAFILLMACVNVANLLLARGAERQKEFAIRRALGAPGARIVGQLLTESMLLAFTGGALGLLVADWANRLLFHVFRLNELGLPMRVVDSIPVDGRVFAFALAVSCLTGILFGVVPALSAVRADVNEPLKEGGRSARTSGRSRVRQLLVASEVALALVVLSGAGLMIKSMSRLLGVDPGFRPKNVLTMQLTVPQDEIYVGPPGLPRFCQDLGDHVAAIPGVLSVSAISHLPFRGDAGRGFQIEGRPPAPVGDMPGASYSVACPDYFRTMGIPLTRGREFNARDTLGATQVVVINETMARKYWPKENPVGKAILLGGSSGPRLTVVGTYGDVRQVGLDAPVRPQFMRPYMQAGWPYISLVIRTASAPLAFTAPVKKTLAGAFPDRPIAYLTTMEEVVHGSTGSRRLPMLLLSAFSALALILAAVGIVGVVGHSVSQRTQEIGIRMALGANSGDVLRLMLNGSLRWVLGGLVVGIAGSAALTRLLSGMLYNVHPLDPAVLAAVSIVLVAVALLASYLPARRATRIDPVAALRTE